MKIRLHRVVLAAVNVISAAALAACASATAVPVGYDSPIEGFRIYDVKPILIVNGQTTSIELIPNYNKAYAVKFSAFLAKQDLTLELNRGMLSKLDSKQDSTAAIALLQDLAKELIPRLVGNTMSGTVAGGTENRFQVYEFIFGDDGTLVGLRPLLLDRGQMLPVRTTKVLGAATTTPITTPQPATPDAGPTPGVVR